MSTVSSYECQEPGCTFNIHAAGTILTDEDQEMQDYMNEEIRDHEERHTEDKAEAAAKDRAQLVNDVADEVTRRISDMVSSAKRLTRRSSGVKEPIEEVTLVKQGDVDASGFESSGQGANSQGVLDRESVADGTVVAENVGRFGSGQASGVLDGFVDVLADVHEISPSVGAPSGAGVGTSDPTEGDQTTGFAHSEKLTLEVDGEKFNAQMQVSDGSDKSVKSAPTPRTLGQERLQSNHDSRGDKKPLRATIEIDLDPMILDGIQCLLDARAEGRDFIIVENPDWIAAIEELVRHEASPSVGAPDGAGGGIPDPTGGDEAGVLGDQPGAPGK